MKPLALRMLIFLLFEERSLRRGDLPLTVEEIAALRFASFAMTPYKIIYETNYLICS